MAAIDLCYLLVAYNMHYYVLLHPATPLLTCEKTTYYAKEDEDSAIMCTGQGNPKPVIVFVTADNAVLMSNMTDIGTYEIATKSVSSLFNFHLTEFALDFYWTDMH